MTQLHVLLLPILLVCLLGGARATTRVCSANTEKVLAETWDSYDLRVQCEANQYQGPTCSQYYMRLQRLLRTQLMLEQCEEDRAAPYFKFFGTPEDPEGIFYQGQVAASIITNRTGELLRNAIEEDQTNLRREIDTLWSNLREDLAELIEAQWANTRTLDAQEEQATRALVSQEYSDTRTDDISQETQNRDYIDEQNNDTRAFDSDTEGSTRAFIEAENDQTRQWDLSEETTTRNLVDTDAASLNALWDSENNDTLVTVSTLEMSDAADFRANVHSEESATRAVVASTTASTQALVQQEESNTIAQASAELASEKVNNTATHFADTQHTIATEDSSATSDQSTVTTTQTQVQSNWASLVSLVSALSNAWILSLNQTEVATFINLLIHIDLQSGTYGWPGSHTILNQFSVIDAFQRDYFNQLRAVANDTVTFNTAHYGQDTQANTAWRNGESYRSSGDYRRAAQSYGIAYRYAITP